MRSSFRLLPAVTLGVMALACGGPPPRGLPDDCVAVGEGARQLRLVAQGSHAAARTDLKADFEASTLAGEGFALVGTTPRPVRVERVLTQAEHKRLSEQLGRICAAIEPAQPSRMGSGHTYFEVTSAQGTVVLQRPTGDAPIEAGRRVARLTESSFDDLLVAFPVDGSGEPVAPVAPPPDPPPAPPPMQVEGAEPPVQSLALPPCRVGTEEGFAVALVLDRSGSMTGKPMAAAQAAAKGLVGALGPKDRFQLISFDNQAQQVHPLVAVGDGQDARGAINQLTPGGGTDGFPALKLAYDALREAAERRRHVIFVTDGMMPSQGMTELASKLGDCAITLSSIAIGGGADEELLADMAKRGGGRLTKVTDLATLSTILVDDVTAARKP